MPYINTTSAATTWPPTHSWYWVGNTSTNAVWYNNSVIQWTAYQRAEQSYNSRAYAEEFDHRRRARELQAPALLDAGRRALQRSIDTYARIRGSDEIRRFTEGHTITFEGVLFRYRIQKTRDLLSHTMNPDDPHIPYSLQVVDKETGQSLSSGCVVIPKTPVIDQILALSLHVQDREDERRLLRTTNWHSRPRQVLEALAT